MVEREYADGYRTVLEMSDSDEIAVSCEDIHHVAFFDSLVHLGNGTREYPRVESLQTLLLASFKIYLFHGLVCFLLV